MGMPIRTPLTEQIRTFIHNPGDATKVGIGKIQQTLLDIAGKGREIYDRDWDLLVILDACRADAALEVAGEYDFFRNPDIVYSKGSTSRQWMRNNFGTEHADSIQKTTYVTANPYSDEMFDGSYFEHLDEVWRDATDTELGVVRPGAVTDRAVRLGRERQWNRMIVHYMQPHMPLINHPEYDYIGAVQEGEISRSEAVEYHSENLRAVLDQVAVLLRNIQAEAVVITADHGEGLGERGVYNHPTHRIHPCLRHVPWVETTAQDTDSHSPEITREQTGQVDVETRLEDLGYLP